MDLEIVLSDFNKEVGDRIKRLRKKNHYTREQLAEIVGISSKFLYEVECGKKGCSSYVLYKITIALDAKSDYLLGGEKLLIDKEEFEYLLTMFSQEQLVSVLEVLKSIHKAINV